MSTTTKQYIIKQLLANNDFLILHPETDANIVIVQGGEGHYPGQATDVQGALEEIYGIAVQGGVTGVKGNNETDYRTGQVNLTAANIGAEAAFTDGSATIASLGTGANADIVTLKAGVSQTNGAIGNSTGSNIVLAKVAKTGAFGDLSGTSNVLQQTLLSAKGDIMYASAASTAARLGIGTNGQVLAVSSSGVPEWKTLGAAAAKGVATSISSSSTDNELATAKAVYTAIDNLPEPMVFKGTVGTSGTIEWSALPAAASSNEGYTYKVITDHATAPICEAGDTIISNGTEWVVIPSGDEPSGTVTSVAAGAGLVTASGSAITSSGTMKAALVDETLSSNASSYVAGGTSKFYAVQLDKNGKLAVNVPWTDNNDNTWRNIKVNGTQILGTGTNTGALDLVAGDNVTITNNSGAVTIASSYTNTATAADDILDGSNTGTEVKYAPYSASVANSTWVGTAANAGKLYLGTVNPSKDTRLNYNGNFYATKLYSGGSQVLTGNQTITLSGDATGSGTTAITVTLANSGVTAGTYSAVTVNAKGLVTAGAQMFEVGTQGQTTPSASLAVGGLFFQQI